MSQSINYTFSLCISHENHIHVTIIWNQLQGQCLLCENIVPSSSQIRWLHGNDVWASYWRNLALGRMLNLAMGRMLNRLDSELTPTSSKSILILITLLSNKIDKPQKKFKRKYLVWKIPLFNIQGIMGTSNVSCPIIVIVITLLQAKYLLRQRSFQFNVLGLPYHWWCHNSRDVQQQFEK